MTPQQIRTVKRLGVALAIAVALVIWLLYTEGAAIVQGGHSTITEVIQLAWAHQPWVIFLLALVVVGIVAFLLGHFVAAPASHYEALRRGEAWPPPLGTGPPPAPQDGDDDRPSRVMTLFALALFTLPFILGAKGCSESDQCRALREAAEAVCRAAPDSASCASLRQQLESCDVPAPDPTPSPTPTPTPDPTPPVNCLVVLCEEGYHCEQGIGCVKDPLPDPDPIGCKPGEIPVIVDGEVIRCDPAPAEDCSIDGEPGAIIEGYAHALGAEINAAMAALRPDCPVGGRCVLTESRLEWQARVIAELRRRGVCAGQHTPTTDEIAVASSATAPREGWHVYAEGLNVPGTIVWAPQAARPTYAAPVTAPVPPTPPPGESCPAEPCPDRSKGAWKIKSKLHGRDKVDNTPVTEKQEPYCRAIGMSPMADGTLRAGCPMRPDGHPERALIEAWVTGGTKLEGPGCEFVDGNPFQFYAAGGLCRLCSADGQTCGGFF